MYVNWIAMQLRKDVFGEDAEIFRPERFLECSNEKKVEMERTVEMSFGTGRYQCPGKVIAFVEIYKVIFEVSHSILPRSAQNHNTLTMKPLPHSCSATTISK